VAKGGDVSDAHSIPQGQDSRTTDWFGQNVDQDAELADELVEELGEEQAERRFEQLATAKTGRKPGAETGSIPNRVSRPTGASRPTASEVIGALRAQVLERSISPRGSGIDAPGSRSAWMRHR
jgi:hypothetical protein